MFVTSADLLGDYLRHPAPLILASDFGAVVRNAPALAILKVLGVKVILYLQNAPPAGRFYARLFRYVIYPLVTRYVAVSEHSTRELIAFGIPRRKIACVRNFAPGSPAPARVPKIPGRVAFAGQVIPQKGLDLLLDAIAIVAAMGVEVTLDVAGRVDGWIAPAYKPFRDDLLSRARRDDIEARVALLGWRDDVPEILARAVVHCSPSREEMFEGMPLVCLEAKRAGTPSVVTPTSSFPEMVRHGVNGWVCRGVSAEALAEGLVYFLGDAARAARAAEAAAASSADYSRASFESGWEGVVRDVRPARGWREAAPRGNATAGT